MSGIILFSDRRLWRAQSGIFNWVNQFLIDKVHSGPDRERLKLIDEHNFRWLEFDDLTEQGVRDVLAAVRTELVPYSQENLPETPGKQTVLEVIHKLVEIANAQPSTSVNLAIVGKAITRAFRKPYIRETGIEIDGDREIGFTLEKDYTVHIAGRVWRMEYAADDDRIQACFGPLYGIPIRTAVAEETGELRVSFVDGSTLECGPDADSEPWMYRGPHRARVWSLPGGRLIRLDPEAPHGA